MADDPLDPPTGEHEYSESGVDRTLIRWMLSLTPAQRLEVLQRHVNSIIRLRAARIPKP